MNPAMINKLKKMQRDMQNAQKQLEETIFTGSAGGGMVTVTVKGDKTVMSIEIDKDALNPDDQELIQDAIVAAMNDAFKNVDDETQRVMGQFTGGMGFGF